MHYFLPLLPEYPLSLNEICNILMLYLFLCFIVLLFFNALEKYFTRKHPSLLEKIKTKSVFFKTLFSLKVPILAFFLTLPILSVTGFLDYEVTVENPAGLKKIEIDGKTYDIIDNKILLPMYKERQSKIHISPSDQKDEICYHNEIANGKLFFDTKVKLDCITDLSKPIDLTNRSIIEFQLDKNSIHRVDAILIMNDDGSSIPNLRSDFDNGDLKVHIPKDRIQYDKKYTLYLKVLCHKFDEEMGNTPREWKHSIFFTQAIANELRKGMTHRGQLKTVYPGADNFLDESFTHEFVIKRNLKNPRAITSYATARLLKEIDTDKEFNILFNINQQDSAGLYVIFGTKRFDIGGSDGRSITCYDIGITGDKSQQEDNKAIGAQIKENRTTYINMQYTPKKNDSNAAIIFTIETNVGARQTSEKINTIKEIPFYFSDGNFPKKVQFHIGALDKLGYSSKAQNSNNIPQEAKLIVTNIQIGVIQE